jgi:ATP-dependent Zn protease
MARRLDFTAYHEAGHGVVAWRESVPFKYISIVPTEDSLGHVFASSHAKVVSSTPR